MSKGDKELSRAVRSLYGISQAKLAAAIGAHTITVSRWERQATPMTGGYRILMRLLLAGDIDLDRIKELG